MSKRQKPFAVQNKWGIRTDLMGEHERCLEAAGAEWEGGRGDGIAGWPVGRAFVGVEGGVWALENRFWKTGFGKSFWEPP